MVINIPLEDNRSLSSSFVSLEESPRTIQEGSVFTPTIASLSNVPNKSVFHRTPSAVVVTDFPDFTVTARLRDDISNSET